MKFGPAFLRHASAPDLRDKKVMNISICIPTYKRAALLRHTLDSIISAQLLPYEILIGDNSGGDADTNNVIEEFESKLPIKHLVHNPPLNYAGNLQTILSFAQGDWVGVMHDDDYYLPGSGLSLRSAISESGCDFYFSEHLICSNDGNILPAETAENSKTYNRNLLCTGLVQDSLGAVLLSQVCMDGWFAKRELIQTVKTDSRWPEYFDTQYLIQFAMNSNNWFYESKPTFVYRLSSSSLTVKGLKVHELFDYYSNLIFTEDHHIQLRDKLLVKYAPIAVTRWIREGNTLKAKECLYSKYYQRPKSFRSLIRFVYHLFCVELRMHSNRSDIHAK